MNESNSSRAVVPLTVLALYGLVVAATVTLWIVFSSAPRADVAWATLAFLVLIETGYLALFLAGWVSTSVERTLPTAARVIASGLWTVYALVGLFTLGVWAGLSFGGQDVTLRMLAVLFTEGVLCALPTGLLFAFAAYTGRRDAESAEFRAQTIELGRALTRLSGSLRELDAAATTRVHIDRVTRDLDASRAALAHAPTALAQRMLSSARPALDELRALAELPLPAESEQLDALLRRVEGLGKNLRVSLSPALAA